MLRIAFFFQPRQWVAALVVLLGLVAARGQAATNEVEYDFNAMLQPVPATAKFSDTNYNIWCGSAVRGDDGQYHLFYSRWPRALGHYAWVTHSEVAHAVSDSPFGPWTHRDVALPARGTNYWDGSCTHNPTVLRIGKKYYLYYMGNYGDGVVRLPLNWEHRNHQRIGVAVADAPEGPWQRFDQPVLDISSDTNAPDALVVTNPSVTQRPDGGVLMIYKAVGLKRALPFGGPVVHLAATADNPLGPFTKRPGEVFGAPGVMFAAEDPFIWRGADRYWAVVKDNDGNFTKRGYSLALWESADGFNWKLGKHALVTTPEVRWADGRLERMDRLERPQLVFENGEPIALLCAAAVRKDRNESFNVQIPLKALVEATSSAPRATGFIPTGVWAYSSLSGHAPDKSSIYSADAGATATWAPRLRSQGPVRISLFVIAHSNNVPQAKVELVSDGSTNTVTVNQRPPASAWVTLGTMQFAGQGEEFVRVRPDGRGNLRVCALRLEVVDARDGKVWQTLVLDDLLPHDLARLRRQAPREVRAGPPDPDQWELTFRDDFDGDRLDTNVWKSAQGQTWGQLQSIRYPENVVVTNGLLRLVTRKEKRGGKEWTSAMISTRHFVQRYGYWESRYRYAAATGLNQSFWMNPGSKAKARRFETDVGLDASFEIDVNEGHYPTDVNATLHQGGLPSQSKRFVADYDLSADFHLYAAEWNEKEIIFYFDGQEIHRVAHTKAHLEVPVIYATAVLPWAGPITEALDGKSMDVDWVRVYQRRAGH